MLRNDAYSYRGFNFTREMFMRIWMIGMGIRGVLVPERMQDFEDCWYAVSRLVSRLVGDEDAHRRGNDYVTNCLKCRRNRALCVINFRQWLVNFKFPFPSPRLSNADRWYLFSSQAQYSFWKIRPVPSNIHLETAFNIAFAGQAEPERTILTRDGPAYLFYIRDGSEFIVRYVGIFMPILGPDQTPVVDYECAMVLYNFHNSQIGRAYTAAILNQILLEEPEPPAPRRRPRRSASAPPRLC